MEIIEKQLAEIKPYENNPRINDEAVKYVKKSIEKFGFKVPLVIDKNGVIASGHTRYKAAIELGMKTLPCVIANDLTEKQVKAFRLADNKVGEIARWDQSMLNIELEQIDIDMSDFGFIELAEIDIDSFFEDSEPKEPKPPEEKEVQCPHCGMYFKV